MLRFPGSVDDATHHRDLHFFHARVLLFPHRHLGAQIVLDLVGHVLEEGAGSASATGAGGHLRGEAAQFQRLQHLLADEHFFGTIAVRKRGQRGANRVADTFLQEHGQSRRCGDNPLGAEASFGESDVHGVVALCGKVAVDTDQILHAADFGGQDDEVVRQAHALGRFGGFECAGDHGISHDLLGVERVGQSAVFVHHACQQRRVERAPVDANTHWAIVLDGHFDHGAKVVVVLLADIDVAWIDAVFRQGFGTIRVLLQQQVAVVMEVADDGHADAEFVECFDDLGHSAGGFIGVHGDAHQFGTRAGKGHRLVDGGGDVRRVGVGHRLDDDGVASADLDVTDVDDDGMTPRCYCH